MMISTMPIALHILLLFILSGRECFHVDAVDPALKRQVLVASGETAILSCHSISEDSVDWYYHRSPLDVQNYVYSNNMVYDIYKMRVTVPKSQPNDYTLKLSDVNLNDTGLYTCVESGGNGQRHTIPLLVVTADYVDGTTTSSSNSVIVGLAIFVAILLIVVAVLIIRLILVQKRCQGEQGKVHKSDREAAQVTYQAGVYEALTKQAADEITPESKNPVVMGSSQHQDHDDDDDAAGAKGSAQPLMSSHPPEQNKYPAAATPPVKPPEPGPLAFILDLDQEDTSGKQVRGVCYHGGRLYVIRSPDAKIEVYDPLTMKRVKIMDVGDPYPGCMALCPTNKCFYITYFKSQMILKAKLDGTPGKPWNVASFGNPDGISVIAKSVNIVVAFRDSAKPTLHVFDPEGKELRTITLGTPIIQPRYAASYQDDKFLVCYGMMGSTSCGVCLVDSSGVVLQAIDTRTEHPLHLAVHKSGFVLVPDFNFQNVALLDNKLKYVREAVTDGLAQPFRLCFDDDYKRLFVGEFSRGCRVLAYDVIYG